MIKKPKAKKGLISKTIIILSSFIIIFGLVTVKKQNEQKEMYKEKLSELLEKQTELKEKKINEVMNKKEEVQIKENNNNNK